MTGSAQAEIPRLQLALEAKPAARWAGLADYRDAARRVTDPYLHELGDLGKYALALKAIRGVYVPKAFRAELPVLAEHTGLTLDQVTALNCYYDGLKYAFCGMPAFGCTAFAIDTPDGPLHARNLDWFSDNAALRDDTLLLDFTRGGETIYRACSWPGANGVLSGWAPGRFAVTLNAVLSDDKSALGTPIVYVIRQVLEAAADFDAAVKALCRAKLPCDCLLMVTGVKAGEMAVIERTPRRHARRGPENGCLVVTNDYRAISGQARGVQGQIGESTCERFDRASVGLRDQPPLTPADCLDLLAAVRMEITVQQMVLHPASGAHWIQLP